MTAVAAARRGRRRRRAVLGAALWPLFGAGPGSAEALHPVIATEQVRIAAQDRGNLEVVFAPADRPALVLKPAQGIWDWSATTKLVIPVVNPGTAPLTLLLEVESGDGAVAGGGSLAGKVAIAPKSAGNLTIWLAAPSPRAMGMVAGPTLAAGGLEPHTLPVTATNGMVDAARVTAIRLGIPRPQAPTRLTVGLPDVSRPSAAESDPYDGIADGFGQYCRGSWPEKVSSIPTLRAGADDGTAAPRQGARQRHRDPFFGLAHPGPFRATGFFRTLRDNDRWWLVTPTGHPFFSIGIDVVDPSAVTYVEGRESMFRDLPARDGPFADDWIESDDRRGLGAERGRHFDHGHAFDFYRANLERKFGGDWRRRWRLEASARLEAWGFNTIGDWSAADLLAMHRLPYTVPLHPEGDYATVKSGVDWWGPMPDPFDPKFAAAVDRMARAATARFGSDPYLVGYFVQNELSWENDRSKDPRQRFSLALGALLNGPQSPAKAALVDQLFRTYRSPERLGEAWGITLKSWDTLRRAGFVPPWASLHSRAASRDFSIFSRHFAEAYYRIVGTALHRYDPHHLYLGSRFAGYSRDALAACSRWCDVVSFNIYRPSIARDRALWTQFHKLGKPALIGEFSFGSTDRGLFWEGVIGAGREDERGHAYARYLKAVGDDPDFIGAHWFEYADEPLTGRTLDGENGHFGFVSVADVPYRGLVAAARAANAAVLRGLEPLSGVRGDRRQKASGWLESETPARRGVKRGSILRRLSSRPVQHRVMSWTLRSVADAKRSATGNSQVASCRWTPSCLVGDACDPTPPCKRCKPGMRPQPADRRRSTGRDR